MLEGRDAARYPWCVLELGVRLLGNFVSQSGGTAGAGGWGDGGDGENQVLIQGPDSSSLFLQDRR